MNTYLLCKKLIDINKKNGLSEKLDVFLLNNRITRDEYDELISLL